MRDDSQPHALSLQVERRILMLRGQRVMVDFDLAELYGIETRALKQAVRRNSDRFPEDFMFELDEDELENLRSQIVISRSHGGSRHGLMAFTEQGVAMLSRERKKVGKGGQSGFDVRVL
jgi:hypothetical protein